ncbi:MAG: NAD(+)/NADH kinase [Anaerolineae bacterium]|nr:NAD(+)/NADH kinase [Anaerolineae bacterium]
MATLKHIGILAHPLRPKTAPVAELIAQQLQARGIDTWVSTRWTEDDVQAAVEQSDLVVAIGGDGAMLRAARVCAPYQVPVLGVNMGQLGFLTEIDDPQNCDSHFDRLLSGDYWIESRMMVQAQVMRDGEVEACADALNDVVVSRRLVTSTIRLEMYIDRDWATTYNGDALIIATPTGSTAYALASGGPILPPELRNILVVPVAPHLSMDRPIVLAEGALVDVIPVPNGHADVVVSVDGRLLWDLQERDRVSVQASENISRFLRMRGKNYFYRSLLDRLEPRIPVPSHPTWNDRKL